MVLSDLEYGKLLFECTVFNGAIQSPVPLNPEVTKAFYNRLSRDLFDCAIPHYRVVAIWHDFDDKHGKSLFRTNDIFGQSCIELSMKMKYLIPSEIGGNDGELGCFYGITDDMTEYAKTSEDFRGFCRDWGLDNGRSIDTRTANILTRSRTEIGSLMIDTSHDDLPQKYEFTTSDVWYTQRMPYEVKFPEVLIPNKFISGIRDVVLGKAPTFMFIMRGTGNMSYEETQKLFVPKCEHIMPCDVSWNLSDFFVIRVPDEGDTELHLTYLEYVDEMVLKKILRDYGKELLTGEC